LLINLLTDAKKYKLIIEMIRNLLATPKSQTKNMKMEKTQKLGRRLIGHH
jgi:hypothetical protein